MSEHPSDDDAGARDAPRITRAVAAIVERRATIEQAKGMLMFVYGIDDDEAFEVLRRQSQQHNLKLRLVAEQILKDLLELSKARGPARRLAFDGLMLTAHQRVENVAARQLNGESKTGVPMKAI
ncbi:MAG: ANTAR domain-containing protein [Mycobacterium sp.]